MRLVKKFIVVAYAVLAGAGTYAAVRNLPVVTGCNFYADCPQVSNQAEHQSASLSRQDAEPE